MPLVIDLLGFPHHRDPLLTQQARLAVPWGPGREGLAADLPVPPVCERVRHRDRVRPVVPDYARYPVHGRSVEDTDGEIGLAAHWVKHLLHYVFIYKAKARPGWAFLPE